MTPHKLQYTFGDAMQDNAGQQCWCITIMAANTISNRKFAKMVHPDFLVKMVDGNLITVTQKTDDCMYWPLMKILAIRMANHSF